MSMPGVKPSAGCAFFVHALIEQAHADDFVLSSIERLRTPGVPGQIWTVPVLCTCAPTHCMNWPIERIMPSCLCRKDGVHGRFSA